MLEPKDLAALRRQKLWSAALSWFTYMWVIAACKYYWHYSIEDVEKLREDVWKKLDAHDGPVIWAANHLTLIDSFLVFWALFPFSKSLKNRLVPWSTPEYRNYYYLGGPVQRRLIRALMYLCRCIPFLREGEDEASIRWRETAYQKCVQVLRDKGAVFVYPGRASRSQFEFTGPGLSTVVWTLRERFLCVYLRGDRQLYTAPCRRPASFRVVADLVPTVLPEKRQRQVSQRLFDKIASMQMSGLPTRLLKLQRQHSRSQSPPSDHLDKPAGEEEWLKHLTPARYYVPNSREPLLRL